MPGVLLSLSGNAADSVFSATLTDNTLSGFTRFVGTVQTGTATTCNAVNGIQPYSYAWTYVSGDIEIYPNFPSAATTKFSVYSSTSASFSAVWKCVVTDASAATVDSDTVTVTLTIEPLS